MLHIADEVARHPRVVALIGVISALALVIYLEPAWNGSGESETWSMRSILSYERPRKYSASWEVDLLMIMALAWALFEYAQLVLMMLYDQEAVHICYQEHCSVAEVRRNGARDQTKDVISPSAASKDGNDPLREHQLGEDIPCAPVKREKRDSISINLLSTPSQHSDDSDADTTDSKFWEKTHGFDVASEPRPICTCKEEDYLVAMEDDVRKPCGHHSKIEPIETGSKGAAEPSELSTMTKSNEELLVGREQASPVKMTKTTALMEGAPVKEEEEAKHSDESEQPGLDALEESVHHFRGELKTVSDVSSMDFF